MTIINDLKVLIETSTDKPVFTKRADNDNFNNNSIFLQINKIDELRYIVYGSLIYSGEIEDFIMSLKGIVGLIYPNSVNVADNYFSEASILSQDFIYKFNKDLLTKADTIINNII
jgi:hypothetical protein